MSTKKDGNKADIEQQEVVEAAEDKAEQKAPREVGISQAEQSEMEDEADDVQPMTHAIMEWLDSLGEEEKEKRWTQYKTLKPVGEKEYTKLTFDHQGEPFKASAIGEALARANQGKASDVDKSMLYRFDAYAAHIRQQVIRAAARNTCRSSQTTELLMMLVDLDLERLQRLLGLSRAQMHYALAYLEARK